MALTDKLTAIGAAIREKEGSADLIPLSDMPDRIRNLSSGGSGGGDDVYKQQTINFLNNNTSFTFTVPAGVTRIGRSAFSDSQWLTSIEFEDASQITAIDTYGFSNCQRLTSFPYLPNLASIQWYAFQGCSNLTSFEIPPKITTLENYCFKSTGLKSITIPATVTTINSQAFAMSNLKTARFLGTPTSISSSTFTACGGITDIYVPWAEDAVSGAPWGASNATIHYNTPADAVIE